MENNSKNKKPKILSLIADDEIKRWEDFLRKNNFLEDEIKGFLSHVNKNYRKKIKLKEKEAVTKIKELEQKMKDKCNCLLTKEEKKFLKDLFSNK